MLGQLNPSGLWKILFPGILVLDPRRRRRHEWSLSKLLEVGAQNLLRGQVSVDGVDLDRGALASYFFLVKSRVLAFNLEGGGL